jgi:uncharacterized phage-associated protein
LPDLKTYDSVRVAEYFLAIAMSKQKQLNTTKVQKLLYILYGYYQAKHNHRILDESPKAWPYGPVFPKTRTKVDYTNVFPPDDERFKELREDEELCSKIDELIEAYSSYTASRLSEWSHEQGSPWHRTTNGENFGWNTPIPDEYIREYFSRVDV